MNCRVCSSEARKAFTARVLGRHDGDFFLCNTCGFLRAGDPYWLPEAYREAINRTDTGILMRNIRLSRLASTVLFTLGGRGGTCLDYAGGYGILTRLMRDIGFDCFWSDPHTENIFARGFEYSVEHGPVDLVTCFEALEHFEDPVAEVRKMAALSGNILLTTNLLPDPVPAPGDWWYYGFSHGQHIAFYSRKSLAQLAGKLGLAYHTDGADVHFFTRKRISSIRFRSLVALNRLGLWLFVQTLTRSRTVEDMNRMISVGAAGEEYSGSRPRVKTEERLGKKP